MEGVYITKTGFRATEWNGDIRQYVDKPIRNILHELRSQCRIEEGVTLGDIIRHVATDLGLAEIIGHFAWANVRAFYAEVNKPPASKSNLKYIELSAYFEIQKPFQEEKPEMDIHFDITGADDEHDNWAIDFTPVNEMAHVPVKLNHTLEVHDWRDWENRPNHELKVDEGQYCFSLLEVLSQIFYEISFHGSPADRNDTLGELMEAKAAVENGEATLVPFEADKETIQ